ncbi:MAG: hypothetical protein OHK0044_18220 [Burkholderiaceae bacterium]
MTGATERVAIITVHGVADQQPGQTVRELARPLCHGGDGASRYVEGELNEVIVPVSPLPPANEGETACAPPHESRRGPGRPSDFYLAHRARVARADLGVALTDHLLWRYRPAERDALYESTRISLKRRADGTPVDLYELYWADYSRLQPGGIRALSAAYQLFFHLGTLARDIVDQAVLANGDSRALRALQQLHAWSAWLLKGPAALLQLAMLLLVAFGTAALLPPAQHRFVLGLGGGVAAFALAVLAVLAAQRASGAVAKSRAALPWVAATAAAAAVATIAAAAPGATAELYFATAIALTAAAGFLLVRRYGETVRGVRSFGFAAVAAAAALLAFDAARMRAHASTLYEWMLTAALHAGEYLLATLLSAWAVLALVQIAALVLGFAVARSVGRELAASLATARIGMVVSTALFALLSVVLWSVIAYVTGLALQDLLYEPAVFGRGYRSAAIFFEGQVQDVGGLFTPLLALVGVVGGIVLLALAPSLHEEIAPSANARSAQWSARLGRWLTAARRWLGALFGGAIPLAAIAGGVVYLLFLLEKSFGTHGASGWIDARGDVLVAIGKWLAGGAVTITALGARFTQTFGKLRIALDAALDIDNYFRDPANRRPPRARIFSRYAALIDYVRARGYARAVIVAHSQGSVITADLLRYLRVTGRLQSLTEGMPIALVTLGSPLRDLYAARFPLLYRWMGEAPSSFVGAAPAAAELGAMQWVNAYRSGDYVGRAIWTPIDDATAFRVATVDAERRVSAARAADRTELCLGAGAHTHYFTNDAAALAAAIDALVAPRTGP